MTWPIAILIALAVVAVLQPLRQAVLNLLVAGAFGIVWLLQQLRILRNVPGWAVRFYNWAQPGAAAAWRWTWIRVVAAVGVIAFLVVLYVLAIVAAVAFGNWWALAMLLAPFLILPAFRLFHWSWRIGVPVAMVAVVVAVLWVGATALFPALNDRAASLLWETDTSLKPDLPSGLAEMVNSTVDDVAELEVSYISSVTEEIGKAARERGYYTLDELNRLDHELKETRERVTKAKGLGQGRRKSEPKPQPTASQPSPAEIKAKPVPAAPATTTTAVTGERSEFYFLNDPGRVWDVYKHDPNGGRDLIGQVLPNKRGVIWSYESVHQFTYELVDQNGNKEWIQHPMPGSTHRPS